MAIARYKVLKDDFGYMLGSNLVLTPEAAEADLVLGRLQNIEYLDPNDELDAAKIRHFYENPTGAKRLPEDEPTLEEAVKGITGEDFVPDQKATDSTVADDGADGGEANVAATSTTDATPTDYNSMTIAQLQDYATAHNIDLTGVTLKDDIVAKIEAADAS